MVSVIMANQLDKKEGCYRPNNSTLTFLEPNFFGSSEVSASSAQDVAGACFITLVALSTLVNSVIIVHFVVKKKYRKSHHMTYLNLAVADLCISVYGAAIRGPGKSRELIVIETRDYITTFKFVLL